MTLQSFVVLQSPITGDEGLGSAASPIVVSRTRLRGIAHKPATTLSKVCRDPIRHSPRISANLVSPPGQVAVMPNVYHIFSEHLQVSGALLCASKAPSTLAEVEASISRPGGLPRTPQAAPVVYDEGHEHHHGDAGAELQAHRATIT